MDKTEKPIGGTEFGHFVLFKNELPGCFPSWTYMYYRINFRALVDKAQQEKHDQLRLSFSDPRIYEKPLEMNFNIDFLKARLYDELLAGIDYSIIMVSDYKQGYMSLNHEARLPVAKTLLQLEALAQRSGYSDIAETLFPGFP